MAQQTVVVVLAHQGHAAFNLSRVEVPTHGEPVLHSVEIREESRVDTAQHKHDSPALLQELIGVRGGSPQCQKAN